ncbi:hypothetical protein I1A62_05510 (plasmid) [Rhodococcus sp. USK10]|uniref:hypothetical protein n=1 Tax=Rhodococcus sp. USK10 TaxID=2789739 RepID=UPI001C5F2C4E|nr:hypothetical protein [Rhodococcus sp. USK10]QYB00458.1 hypothetical protein I1A62_05510 [Rhodococcus sp. USK10]
MFDAPATTIADLNGDPTRVVLLPVEGKTPSAGADVHLYDGLLPSRGRVVETMFDASARRPAARLRRTRPDTARAFDIALTCHPIVQPEGRIQAVETVAGLTPSMGGGSPSPRGVAAPPANWYVRDLRNAVRTLLTDGPVRRMTVNHT